MRKSKKPLSANKLHQRAAEPRPPAPPAPGKASSALPAACPPELASRLVEATGTGRWMIGLWWIDGGRLHLWRYRYGLPEADFRGAVELLRDELAKDVRRAAQALDQVKID